MIKFINKRFIGFLVFMGISLNSFNQIDYNQELIDYPTLDLDGKIAKLFYIQGYFGRIDPDKILPLIQELEVEANGQNRYDALAFFDYLWASYLVNKSLLNEARIPLSRAETYFLKHEVDTMLAETNNLLANIEYLLANDQEAEKHYLTSMEYGKKSAIPKFEMYSLVNYARLLARLDRTEEAIAALELYIDFYEVNKNHKNVSSGYGTLGNIYQSKNENSKAIQLFQKSLEASKKADDLLILSNGLTNIAIAYFIQEDYGLSFDNFNAALVTRKRIGNPYYLSQGYHNLGDYYQSLSKYTTAITYYDSALSVSLPNDLKAEALDAYRELATTHELLNDLKTSNNYLKKYIDLQASFQKENNDYELMLLQLSHDFKQQRERIIGEERETTLKTKVTTIQKEWKFWIWIIVGCAIVFLLILLRAKRK